MPVWCQWQISHANREYDLHADMTRIPVNDLWPALSEYEYVSSCLHWYYVQFYSVPRLIFKAISIKKSCWWGDLKRLFLFCCFTKDGILDSIKNIFYSIQAQVINQECEMQNWEVLGFCVPLWQIHILKVLCSDSFIQK